MKRVFSIIVVFLCVLPVYCFSVTFLKINDRSSLEFKQMPEKMVLSCDVSTAGGRVDLEIFLDTNNNNLVDRDDYLLDFMSLTDGINWIRDIEAPGNDIPGDESTIENFIETTRIITTERSPVSSQNWLVRVTDADRSTATALINWNIRVISPCVSGYLTDKITGIHKPGALVLATETDYPDMTFAAVTDSAAQYRMQLPVSRLDPRI